MQDLSLIPENEGSKQEKRVASGASGLQYEQTLLQKAYEKVAEKKYGDAVQLFEDVLKKFLVVLSTDQKSVIAAELSQLYLWLGKYDKAEFHAKAAVAGRNDNERALVVLGKIAIAEYKFPVARGIFSRLSDDNANKYMGLCLISIRLRDANGALHFIREAAKYIPSTDAEYRVLAAYCRLMSGSAVTAVTEMRDVQKEVENDPALMLLIAEIFMTAGNYGEAEALAKKVEGTCPKSDQAMAIFAHAEYADEEYGAAEEYARRAVAINPNNAYAQTVLMKLATRVGNYSRAENIGKTILDRAPEYSLAHANLGDVYFNEGRYGLAEIEYEQTMQLMSADTKGARLRTARMKFIAEDFKDAAEILEKLIATHHTYYDDAMCDLALCYDRLGDTEKKESVIDKMEMRRSFYHRTEKLLQEFQH